MFNRTIGLAFAVAIGVAACGGGGDGDGGGGSAAATTPAAQQQETDAFVKVVAEVIALANPDEAESKNVDGTVPTQNDTNDPTAISTP